MYIYIYVHVIIGGIGKTYAAQGKHSSHGERDNKGIKRVYTIPGTADSVYKRYLEKVNDRIAQSLYDRYMLLEKLLTFPHAVNQILPLIFFINKKLWFFYILYLYICMLPFIKNDFVVINLNLLLITQSITNFFPLGFVKISFSWIYFIYHKTY